MSGIETYTTGQLIKELFSRHDVVLVVTCAKPPNGSSDGPGAGRIRTSYHGGAVAALGLAELAKDTIKELVFDVEEDGDDEEVE